MLEYKRKLLLLIIFFMIYAKITSGKPDKKEINIIQNINQTPYPIFSINCPSNSISCTYITSNEILLFSSFFIVGYAYQYDQEVREEFSNLSPKEKEFFSEITELGNGKKLVPSYLTLYLIGTISQSEKTKQVAKDLIITFILAGGTTSIIKSIVGRERPYGTTNKHIFRPFSTGSRYTSFPSGHTTIAFQTATVLAYQYKFGFIAYIPAMLVALSRIALNAHWLSDTVMGAIIGIAIPTLYYHKQYTITTTIYLHNSEYRNQQIFITFHRNI